MDCSKRSAGAMAALLPEETLVEILSRVPAKSICRFKCVSKAWRDLIADPHNRKKLPQAMEGLFYGFGNVGCFSFIDTTARSVPVDIDPCFSFLTQLPGIQNLILLDSCNGLILLMHYRRPNPISRDEVGYIVCNPTTKQWLAVPNPVYPPPLSNYAYLTFDPAASSHFHLLEFGVHREEEEVFVWVLAYSSETGTWNRNQINKHKEQGQLKGWHHQISPCFGLFGCAFVNGILHMIDWDLDQHQRLIGAVDVQGKTGKLITVPNIASASNYCICYFGQSQGRVHCVIKGPLDVRASYKLHIWVLQDYDTQEWVLKDTLSSLGLFGEISEFKVIDIHQDRNLVFLAQNDKLLAYDMDRKQVSVVATFGGLDWVQDFVRYVPYFSELPSLTNKHCKCVL